MPSGWAALSDLWPLFGLTIATPRLELRLPREPELVRLAHLAGAGVHRAGERPFLTPWTDGGPDDRARSVLQGHWNRLGYEHDGISVDARDGQPVVSDLLRLTRERWAEHQPRRPEVKIGGLTACLPMFGL